MRAMRWHEYPYVHRVSVQRRIPGGAARIYHWHNEQDFPRRESHSDSMAKVLEKLIDKFIAKRIDMMKQEICESKVSTRQAQDLIRETGQAEMDIANWRSSCSTTSR